MTHETRSRREFLPGLAAGAATLFLSGGPSAAADGKKTFTILHTNDLHSNFSGWVQTMPGKGWSVLLRLYGPLEPWFDEPGNQVTSS